MLFLVALASDVMRECSPAVCTSLAEPHYISCIHACMRVVWNALMSTVEMLWAVPSRGNEAGIVTYALWLDSSAESCVFDCGDDVCLTKGHKVTFLCLILNV
jgi:hypothetical protein